MPDGPPPVVAAKRRQSGLEALDVARRLRVRVARGAVRVDRAEPAADRGEGGAAPHAGMRACGDREFGARRAEPAGERRELPRPRAVVEDAAGVGVGAQQQGA